MRQLTRSLPGAQLRLGHMEGITTLHSACATLMRTPPTVIRSMNVLIALADFPIPASAVVDLAERIAGEYGLIASAEVGADHLSARLVRPDSQPELKSGRCCLERGQRIHGAIRSRGTE